MVAKTQARPLARASAPPPPDFLEAALSVLGYREDGEWVALALEMDLRGYGATFAEALAELRGLVAAQIRFAELKAQPEMIWFPADPVWWERFAEARRDRLEQVARGAGSRPRSPFQVGGLALPAPEKARGRQGRFLPAHAAHS